MLKNAPLFLGLRYLRPKRSFVSVITLISVCGVMLGVAVMVIVMAIFKGWQVEYRKVLMGFEPHVLLTQEAPVEDAEPSNWRDVLALAQTTPGVQSAQPVAQGLVVLDAGGDLEALEVMGLDAESASGLVARLSRHLKAGTFDLEGDSLILTDAMARKLGVQLDDVITVNSARNIQHMVSALQDVETTTDTAAQDAVYEEAYIVGQDLRVAGILRGDTAGERGYLPLHLARELFDLEDRVTGITIDLADPETAPAIEQQLLASTQMPPDWYTGTWLDSASFMLQNVENQQSLLYFLLLFIVFVAASCVMNTTITVTVQKRREIGILTALGARGAQVIGIFIAQAMVVSFLGIGLGVGLGATLLRWRNDLRDWIADVTGRDFFPQDIYFLSSIPSHIVAADLLSVGGMALVLCLLAALFPAWIAARVDPAVALRD